MHHQHHNHLYLNAEKKHDSSHQLSGYKTGPTAKDIDEHAKALIKNLINTVLYNSLAQAIFRMWHTPNIVLKCVLFTFVTATTSLSSFMVIKAAISYFNYEVVTTSRTVFESPAKFPAVKLCHSYMFTTKYAFEFLKEINYNEFPNISIMDAEPTADNTLFNASDFKQKKVGFPF